MRLLVLLTAAVCLLVPCALPAGAADDLPPAGFEVLARGVHSFAPIGGGKVLYSQETGDPQSPRMRVYDPATGVHTPWKLDWEPAGDGWAGYNEGYGICGYKATADGSRIMFMCAVTAPADAVESPPFLAWRDCFLFLFCDPDGGNVSPAMLGTYAGGGPEFALTEDGKYLLGSWCFECEPDLSGYIDYLSHVDEHPGMGLVVYDIAADELHWELDYPMPANGHNSLSNPMYMLESTISEYLEFENVREMKFANYLTGGVLGDYLYDFSTGAEEEFYPKPVTLEPAGNWVLPDAAIVHDERGVGLAGLDGRFVPLPGDWLTIECYLADGSVLFSDAEDGPVRHGRVDWETFTLEWAEDLPVDVDLTPYRRISPLSDSSGVLVWGGADRDEIWLLRLKDPAGGEGEVFPAPDLTSRAEPRLVARGVGGCLSLGDGTLLVAREDHGEEPFRLEILDPRTGATRDWALDWEPAADGWAGYAQDWAFVGFEQRKWDDGLLLYLGVDPPADGFVDAEECERWRYTILLLSCDRDGGNPCPVFLGSCAGDGPSAGQTEDGRYLVAWPVMSCTPDAAGLADYANNERWRDTLPVLVYDFATGERLTDPDDEVPAAGYNDFRELEEVDQIDILDYLGQPRVSRRRCLNYLDGGQLRDYMRFAESPLAGYPPDEVLRVLEPRADWLPGGACLTWVDGDRAVVRMDGTVTTWPGKCFTLYRLLPDGTCLFSTDPMGPVKHGLIDWETFTVEWSVAHRNLPSDYYLCRTSVLPDSSAIVYRDLNARSTDESALWLYELERPGEYVRMNVGPSRVPDRIWNDR